MGLSPCEELMGVYGALKTEYNSLRDIVAIVQDRAIAAAKREISCSPAVRKL